MIRTASTWTLGLISLAKLHSFSLISLAVGIYFVGLSQPGREFWANLLSEPSLSASVLMLLGAIAWILSLGWSTSRAQSAYELDRATRHQRRHERGNTLSATQALRTFARAIPSIAMATAAFAIAAGALGVHDRSESERTLNTVNMVLQALLLGVVGVAHLIRTWNASLEARLSALRGWAICQIASLSVLLFILNSRNLLPIIVSASTGVLLFLALAWLVKRDRRVSRWALVAAVSIRVICVAGAIFVASEEADCLRNATWDDGRPSWNYETFPNIKACEELLDRGDLDSTALVVSYLGYSSLVVLSLMIEFIALWSWKRFAARNTTHSAHDVPPRRARSLLLDALVALTPAVVGCMAFGLWPVQTANMFGAFPIAMLALATWTVLLTWLFIELPVAWGIGPWPLALPIWLLCISPWTDNHRMVDVKRHPEAEFSREALSDECRTNPHPALCQRFMAWNTERSAKFPSEPIFIVATSGGGIRAAYWTAQVLARIEDASCGKFSRNTFAISGVSGGSLGAAIFHQAAQHTRAQRSTKLGCNADTFALDLVDAVFKHDLMSPIVGSMLFPDAVQRFFPAWIPWGGRGRAFEVALETAWRESAETDSFSRPFESMFEDKKALDPLLLLVSTNSSDGSRVVSSPVDLQDPLAYWLQDSDLSTHGMRLSTAAHNSARFPVVSPPARVEDLHGRLKMRIVDGGYFENSSVATARIPLRSVLRAKQDPNQKVVVLLIENDPALMPGTDCGNEHGAWKASAVVETSTPPSDFAFEINAIAQTLLNTRSARTPWHQSEIGQSICGRSDAEIYPIFISQPGHFRSTGNAPDAAMSWFLSNQTKRNMRMKAGDLVQFFLNKFETLEGE